MGNIAGEVVPNPIPSLLHRIKVYMMHDAFT